MKTLRLLVLLALTSSAQAQMYEKTSVPPNHPVMYSQNYSTLQKLSDAVPATGGTMMIAPGTYTVSTVITLKSHTIVQCLPGATLTMANGGAALSEHWIFVNQHHDEAAGVLNDTDIHIRGCSFDGGTASPSTGADGVRFVWASNVEISDSIFTHFGSGTAFLAVTRGLVANSKAFGINDGCFNAWHAASYLTYINDYCETTKHGFEITGTDTAQTSAGITSHVVVINPEVVLYSNYVIGAGIWFNSGAFTDTGAGVTDAQVYGGHITTSGLGSSVGDCVKVSGSGDTRILIDGVHCDNAFISVAPSDIATSYPADIHIRNAEVNLTNTYAGGAIQIKTGTSGVSGSRIIGAGYSYCVDLIGATNQYSLNNSCIAGTDGTAPRVHTDGTSLATALIVDPDETGSTPLTTVSGSLFGKTSIRSPSFLVGTNSNGSLQYAGSNKIVLDADDASTGNLALRTDSGAGAVDRLTVANSGAVAVAGSFTADTLIGTTSSKSAQFIVGSTGAGLLQTSTAKVVLDSTTSSTGTLALRTDSGGGLIDRVTVSNAGQVGVTIATGTAPFSITSTTNVANLNASLLNGATFAAPGSIGSGTPGSGAFTTLTSSSGMALSQLATQATNTIDGNATSGTAVPTALAIGTCSTSTSALIWTTNTGFGCNTVKATTVSPISFGTTAAFASATTAYACPNLNNAAAGTNSGCLVSFAGTLKNMYVWTSTTPGNTFNYLFTLMVGTPGSQSATSVTCTISNTAQTCNDTSHTAAITAGQAWSIRIQPSTGATTMSNGNYGLELDN